jgi:hypothetical protein
MKILGFFGFLGFLGFLGILSSLGSQQPPPLYLSHGQCLHQSGEDNRLPLPR